MPYISVMRLQTSQKVSKLVKTQPKETNEKAMEESQMHYAVTFQQACMGVTMQNGI